MATVRHDADVRPAAVAGAFYAADPDRLRQDVAGLMAAVPEGARPAPRALIAPHAGYVYSGPVAAHAFAALRDSASAPRRIVVIGPAHYVAVRGIAIPTAAAFATPLGRVPVDREALARLGDLPCVVEADVPHAPEHALEVELPFLQSVLGPFTLVPLLVGDAAPEQVDTVLERVWDGSLVVVSSDLSHYLDYTAAQRRDAATATAIERRNWAALRPNDACGYLAVAGLLRQTARRGLTA